jgi:hypothetical protein
MRGQAFIRTGEGNWYEGLDDERIFAVSDAGDVLTG